MDEPTLVEALVPLFAAGARRAFSRGLLHGYRTEEDSLLTVRGRIRIDHQIRRRFGIPVPLEVRYDDFTVDVLPNRLIKAAAWRLLNLRIHTRSRVKLAGVLANLEDVDLVEFPPGVLSEVRFDRLNEHYREAVELSRLILRHTSIETQRGNVRASGFLVDMNSVFQEFVTRALRQALGLSERTFRSDKGLPGIWLDRADSIRLKPDLTWWEGTVGNATYRLLDPPCGHGRYIASAFEQYRGGTQQGRRHSRRNAHRQESPSRRLFRLCRRQPAAHPLRAYSGEVRRRALRLCRDLGAPSRA